MLFIVDLKAKKINEVVNLNVLKKLIIDFKNSTSYVDLKVFVNEAMVLIKDKVVEMLPWVQLVISNEKRLYWIFIMTFNPSIKDYFNEF